MIPIRDVIPSRTTPIVTIALIVINVLVFVYELMLTGTRGALERFFDLYGVVPAHFSWVSAFTAIFLHAGWLHLGGNMLSLWIFGDNVEDRMGHGRFFVFYICAGLVANLVEIYFSPHSGVPLVGASGAIAGVMGAYLVLFPHSRVLVLLPFIIFWDIVEVPAVFFLVFWFLAQILGGIGRLAAPDAAGGVAFWAHVGGFAVGILGVWLFKRPERDRVDWWGGRK